MIGKGFETVWALFQAFNLVLVPPKVLYRFQKGQFARIERIYEQLIKEHYIPEWVTLDIFVKSAETWEDLGFKVENNIFLKRL